MKNEGEHLLLISKMIQKYAGFYLVEYEDYSECLKLSLSCFYELILCIEHIFEIQVEVTLVITLC